MCVEDRFALAVRDGHGGVRGAAGGLAVGALGALDPHVAREVIDDGVEGVLECLGALELAELRTGLDVERAGGGGEAEVASARAALESGNGEGEVESDAEEELAVVNEVDARAVNALEPQGAEEAGLGAADLHAAPSHG